MASGQHVPTTTGRGDAAKNLLIRLRLTSFNQRPVVSETIAKKSLLLVRGNPLDKAQLLGLTPTELTVLVGGMRYGHLLFRRRRLDRWETQ